MKKHLEEKLLVAKTGINMTWTNFLKQNSIPASAKHKVFIAVSRSVMCYGAQGWGYLARDEVEKLQRFFLKKLFGLPRWTPNHILSLETGVHDMYLYTLKCHFKYMVKVFNDMDDSRLPKRIAHVVKRKEILWYEEWVRFSEKHSIPIDHGNLTETLKEIVAREGAWMWEWKIERAKQSIRHPPYLWLEYNLGENNYFHDKHSLELIQYVFKCRGGLILNSNAFANAESGTNCTLCNLREEEDITHFLAVCPVLAEFREAYFGEKSLSREKMLELLNGKSWEKLYLFCKTALRYRKYIVGEGS